MAMLKTCDLAVGYNKKALIENIRLEIEAGKIVVLIGPNGAGKSTILKTMAGLLEEIGGVVLLEEIQLGKLELNKRAQSIATVLTERVKEEYLTVFDVVAGGRYPYTGLLGKLCDEDRKIIDEALNIVGAFDIKDNEFSKISDGQKQRVLLARAIAQEPRYMILDEPTSFLDIGYKLSFVDTLKNISCEKNVGILMSLHELEIAYMIADKIVCISESGETYMFDEAKEAFASNYIEKLFGVDTGKLKNIYNFEKKYTNPTSQVNVKIEKRGTKFLMVQGTMSSAGKSLLVAGLCRIFMQDGIKVAPFKSQNMALNSYVTKDGLEMGRAQVMQAEAAGVMPSVYMNPILLKPTSDSGSQIIVNGKVRGNMKAKDYFEYKTQLIPDIISAIDKLSEQAQVIIIEGAGSPAEINLKQNDIVNMGIAKMVDAPVLLVGDIDRGGVFAQLLGTIELLEDEERQRIKGLVVNKFRGDKSILDPGLDMLTERSGIPVVGVVPYMHLQLEDEDSLSEIFDREGDGLIKIGVIKLPHISNFTDFDVFEQVPEVSVHYITKTDKVDGMDMIILPGSKNTISDMRWLKETGLESAIKKYSSRNKPIIGICGGYQMLGSKISDPFNMESGGEVVGLGILPIGTILSEKKHRRQVKGCFSNPTGMLWELSGVSYEGYEIHMGETVVLDEHDVQAFTDDRSGYCKQNIWGSYVHGLFDNADVVKTIVSALAKDKGIDISLNQVISYKQIKDREYDKLADALRGSMDMDLIYEMCGIKR